MTVVRIPPTLRAEAGGEREIQAAGETVRELLEDLGARFPALAERVLENGDVAPFVNVYVGGEDIRTRAGLDTEVEPGQQVILLPAMAAASRRSPAPPPGRHSRPMGTPDAARGALGA